MRYRRYYSQRNRDGSRTVVSFGLGGTVVYQLGRYFFGFLAIMFVLFWPWAFHWPLWVEILCSVIYYPVLLAGSIAWLHQKLGGQVTPRPAGSNRKSWRDAWRETDKKDRDAALTKLVHNERVPLSKRSSVSRELELAKLADPDDWAVWTPARRRDWLDANLIYLPALRAKRKEVEKQRGTSGSSGLRDEVPTLSASSNQAPSRSVQAVQTPESSRPDPSLDPLDQLSRLGSLRDAGVITVAEFEAKKEELLRRI